jgi:hypothetical protein
MTMNRILIKMPDGEKGDFESLYRIFCRHLSARSQAEVVTNGQTDLALFFELDPSLPAESFRISGQGQEIIIAGGDRLGLLYGAGKFLHTSRFASGGLAPSTWRGVSIPQKEVRGIYFATHFHNFYHDAPLEQVERYIEDIALWGFNTLSMWFDMHHYTGIDDPEAGSMLNRLRFMLQTARRIGLKTSLTTLANEAFASTPLELRADWTAGHDGYFRAPQGHYHVEICPSRPGGADLIIAWRRQVFEAFKEIPIDYLWIWPYDQGGCTCPDCAPWGANGFLRLAPPLSDLARSYFPGTKVVLSTWYFDLFASGEWEGLAKFLTAGAAWADYLMADFVGGGYPEFVIKNGVPGDLPLLGFPEISMYGATPWGGFGANPYPSLIAGLFEKASELQAGGFPYSEGIFEDMNKVVCIQLYWDPAKKIDEILKEYIAYEYSAEAVDGIYQAILLLEKSLPRRRIDQAGQFHDYPSRERPWLGEQRFVISDPTGMGEAWRLLQEAHGCIPAWSRESWRWRILYLRGLIDSELAQHDFYVSPRCEAAFEELVEIYHARQAGYAVSPPTRAAIAAARE